MSVGVSDCHQNRSATDDPLSDRMSDGDFSQELATVSLSRQDDAATLAQANAHGAGTLAAGSERHLVSVGEKCARFAGLQLQGPRTSGDFAVAVHDADFSRG